MGSIVGEVGDGEELRCVAQEHRTQKGVFALAVSAAGSDDLVTGCGTPGRGAHLVGVLLRPQREDDASPSATAIAAACDLLLAPSFSYTVATSCFTQLAPTPSAAAIS